MFQVSTVMFRIALLTLFLSSILCAHAQGNSGTQTWVDKNGQKIEARFVKADQENLTVEMYGEELVLPLDTLSPFSRALAMKMRSQGAQATVPQVPVWTDVQGRVIRANFVRADVSSITLEMNGQNFTLPLEMLDAKSMRQAFIFSQKATSSAPQNFAPAAPAIPVAPSLPPAQPAQPPIPSPKPTAPPPPVITKTPEPAAVKGPTSKGTDPNGPLDPTKPQIWVSSDGRPLEAYFIDLKGNEITIKTKGGQNLSMSLDKFDSNAPLLAKKLKALKDQENQKLAQAVAKRKSMKVPAVTEDDLDKSHSLKNSEGNTVDAKFIEADDEGVVIAMSNNPNRRIPLPWEKFSEESQALLEALRRIKKTMVPKFAAAKGNKLPSFSNGKFSGYNSVIETERFDVGLLADPDPSHAGVRVTIWLKSDDDNLPPRKFTVYFQNTYTFRTVKKNPDGKIARDDKGTPIYRWPRAHRRITKFDTLPEPSMDREKITLTGTFDNGGKFEYNMELNAKGLLFWSELDEPKPAKAKSETDRIVSPTRLHFLVGVPGLIQDAKNVTADKMEKIVGDAYLSLRPQSGKPQKYPFKEQWTVTKKKYAGEKLGALKSMTVEGYPYGDTKLTAIPMNTSGMNFGYGYSYGMQFPFQGLHFVYSGNEDRFKQEIPKSRALKVLLTEVD